MGAIQNSINQMIGAAGTVAATTQHLAEQKKSVEKINEANEIAKEAAKKQDLKDKIETLEQGKKLSMEIDKNLDAMAEQGKQRAEDTMAIQEIENSLKGSYSNVHDKKLRDNKNLFMSEKAFKSMSDAIEAKRASIQASTKYNYRWERHSARCL